MSIYLKTLRENLFLTQEQVSELTGVPVKTLRNWEQEVRKPSDWTLDLIMDRLLRVKLEEISNVDEEHGVVSFLTIKEVLNDVAKSYDISTIYLFGSYAKGTPTDTSDIDLYMESSLFGLTYFEFVEKLRTKLGKKIGLLSNKTVDMNTPIYTEIMNTGLLIYERR